MNENGECDTHLCFGVNKKNKKKNNKQTLLCLKKWISDDLNSLECECKLKKANAVGGKAV